MIKTFTLQNLQKKNFSAFKQHYSEVQRIDKRLRLKNREQQLQNFCFVVVEYPKPSPNKPFQLMYIKGSLKLVQLREAISMRLENKKSNGRILDWNSNISALSKTLADRDGFLYLYIGKEDVF